MPELVYSEQIGRYFKSLESEAKRCYAVAEVARKKGYDPETEVEIPMAEDLALRAQELTGIENTADKIRELSEAYESREEVSIMIAKEVATRNQGSPAERLENAVRIGLAVLTEGILVAPLEGIGTVEIKTNPDGTDYAEISFAGPIRSAGGTGQAMSVLIADIVRRELGIDAFKAKSTEVQRFKEEVPLYKKARSLQYTPSPEEIGIIIKGCPVSISGEGTEKEEVSGNRDLPRVETNRIRGGACLVIAEGMCLKAQKIKKHVDKLGIEGWDFLDEYINKYASSKDGDKSETKEKGISPNFKYIKETIAGRPVFGHPSVKGSLRLRYGRSRTLGLASIAVNPATMYLSGEFMAIGTQVKIERPGKAGAVTPCDSIEGPTILLNDGSVVKVNSAEEAVEIKKNMKEIIDMGEILIPFGEFLENNHPLVPGAYCHEWWIQEAEVDLFPEEITPQKAVELAKDGAPLHPNYVYFWDYSDKDSISFLRDHISQNANVEDSLTVDFDEAIKKTMEDIGLPHTLKGEKIVVKEYEPFLYSLGLDLEALEKLGDSDAEDPIEYVSALSGTTVRSKSPTSIGSRMARPEKAKERRMNPAVHSLFPLGESGGSQRLIPEAVQKKVIEVIVSARKCIKCGKKNAQIRCTCGGRTEIIGEPRMQRIPIQNIYRQALVILEGGGNISRLKGVKKMMNKTKTPEALEKGILRAKHDVYVFKDGTTRYDMTDLPVTHFKPKEIELSIERANELGYTHDIHGKELSDENQVVELMVQDFIASEDAGPYLVKVTNFVDELLTKYYELEPFYNVESSKDLIGHLVVGLAPHTSGGVLGRLIGFNKGRAGYAHPFFHAAKRRNCDGDEDCIMLLLDGLLNFSQSFLPEKRGGKMDAPLVLTTRINPDEIDKEAHNVDTMWSYPLEFYLQANKYTDPKDVIDIMDTVEKRLGTEGQYQGFGYTHDTSDISEGPKSSNYTRLGKMTEKMEAQIQVAKVIRAVDEHDVVSRVIQDHFIPDLMGNFNKFCLQKVRCTKCNKKYRRPPLSDKCTCGGNLTLTIHKGGVKKYLETSLKMIERFELPDYLAQRVKQIGDQIDSLFENDKVSTPSLEEFM
ncbi:MAG: DNA polymerase II large subunit [Thermoplasmata archaeon]